MANKALVLPSAGAPLALQTRPIPTPLPNQVVVKNHALAINPLDTGMQSHSFMVRSFPCVLGSDVSGTIHNVGSAITKFAPGDRVAGFACMVQTGELDQGAFQEYVLLFQNAVTRLPVQVSFAQGAALPMAVATAGVGLFVRMGFPWGEAFAKQQGVILITGASSSVGIAAVQICRILGFTVFATAGAKNHGYLEGMGASRVFDYKTRIRRIRSSMLRRALVESGIALRRSRGMEMRRWPQRSFLLSLMGEAGRRNCVSVSHGGNQSPGLKGLR